MIEFKKNNQEININYYHLSFIHFIEMIIYLENYQVGANNSKSMHIRNRIPSCKSKSKHYHHHHQQVFHHHHLIYIESSLIQLIIDGNNMESLFNLTLAPVIYGIV
ncbi:hypothetical protein ACTFIR_011835 [Dictyostelium discoideum]